MVFNWFRRQFGTNEETSSATPEVEQEQTASEPLDIEIEAAPTQPTEASSSAVAEDYLSFAKAAYKNIQKRQLEETPEIAPVTESESVDTTQTTLESVEPATTETSTVEETPPVTADVLELVTDAAINVVEDTEPVEAAVEDTEPVLDAEPETATNVTSPEAQQETVEPVLDAEPEIATNVTSPEAQQETLEPVAEPAPESVTLEAESAPVPIWARNADRQARLERLKATALETPEPEPIKTPIQPAATTVEMEEVSGLAFDEGFMWSAEVLAAQGRRAEDVSIEEISWLNRLRQGLDKTRRSLINQLKAIVGQGPLNQDAVSEIEALLLQADVGVEATDYIISTLQQKLREEVLPPEQAIAYLKTILRDLLDRPCQEAYSPTFVPEKDTLNIWLMTGVNGAGKTTTIGKLAHLASKSGYRCLIGAADTFRAAAVEQVKVWGERSGTEVIANPGKNTDPAAVVFDAIAAAQSRNVELLLVDTAGRLQNKKNLMEELAKIRRIVDKKAPDAKVEALLVLDATLGQNGLRQAEVFSEAAKLSGVVLTKLDGTARGGVALAVVQQLGLPIRFIGAGEGIEDLRPFSSYEFVEALLSG